MNLILRWLLFAFAITFIAWIIPGIRVENFFGAMFVCIILALINTFIKPLLQTLTLPISVVTFGLFTLVLNALLLMFAGWVTPGFVVDGFWSALFGSILLSLFAAGINKIHLGEQQHV